ncbi:hypothetical protein PVAP13_3NG057694 [Panicum virgatum]|uniref:Uncharacterized protein n=1 Tax=Panicum virgatum TaxID=38727 RepID=A0A8T0U6C7_PANVG|nr:hypothetical protein PVAP13_3NG057694 [Panicum virgatum]
MRPPAVARSLGGGVHSCGCRRTSAPSSRRFACTATPGRVAPRGRAPPGPPLRRAVAQPSPAVVSPPRRVAAWSPPALRPPLRFEVRPLARRPKKMMAGIHVTYHQRRPARRHRCTRLFLFHLQLLARGLCMGRSSYLVWVLDRCWAT